MPKTSVTCFLLITASLVVSAQQVAFIDLTSSSKTPEPVTSTFRGSGGGLFDHRGSAPGTPPISVKLVRVTTYAEGKAMREALDVEVTNRGDKEMSLPAGTDYVSSLATGEPDRQYLSFTVRAGNDPRAIVASGRAATNGARPESVVLQVGESVVFRLPFDKFGLGVVRARSVGANLELAASVQLGRVVVRDGEDWNVQLGDAVKSENTLLWR